MARYGPSVWVSLSAWALVLVALTTWDAADGDWISAGMLPVASLGVLWIASRLGRRAARRTYRRRQAARLRAVWLPANIEAIDPNGIWSRLHPEQVIDAAVRRGMDRTEAWHQLIVLFTHVDAYHHQPGARWEERCWADVWRGGEYTTCDGVLTEEQKEPGLGLCTEHLEKYRKGAAT